MAVGRGDPVIAGTPDPLDTVVVGGGQAGLALAYHLQLAGRRFVVSTAPTGSAVPGGTAGTP